jgi:hypothetical protein
VSRRLHTDRLHRASWFSGRESHTAQSHLQSLIFRPLLASSPWRSFCQTLPSACAMSPGPDDGRDRDQGGRIRQR